jgi:hypothetical protein
VKLFGWEINLGKKAPTPILKDNTPEIQVPIRSGKAISQTPRLVSPVLGYNSSRQLGRGQFICAEYDLNEIGRVEDTESFVRQAFDKKVALMFKEGWDVVGRNPRTVKYIRIRLAQISRASETPSVKLLRDIGSSLIRKSNAFLVKVRNEEASGGRMRPDPRGTTELKPVAAYFPVPAETMEVSYSGNKISKWRQKMPDGNFKEYNPRDVIHFYYDKKDGFTFGTPQLVPVLDDIRALRKIEENIELLVYQHLFPLFQFKVGTPEVPASIDENGEREVDVIRREIQYMPSEGGIVTTERHEIVAVGAEGRAIRAEGYLEHFKKRVIAGLGVSAVDLGDGNTTNRSTSDNMSRNLIDSVKDFQQVLEFFFNEFIIAELLLESTFGDEVLDDDNRVWLKFKEIDIDAQIKKEAHMADQFAKNLVSQAEARLRVGYEPMQIPTTEDMESMDPTELQRKFPEWHQSFFKLIQEPLELIKAAGNAEANASSMAAGKSPSTAVQPGDVDEAHEKKVTQEKEIEKERSKAKIASAKAIAKAKPKPKVRDAFVSNRFDEVRSDVMGYYQPGRRVDHNWVAQIITVSMSQCVDYLIANQVTAFRSGYSRWGDVSSQEFLGTVASARISFRGRAERYINRLVRDVISSLKRNVLLENSSSTPESMAIVRSVFDTLRYRADFIENVEIDKAHALGEALALRNSGNRFLVVRGSSAGCDRCKHVENLDTHFMVMEDVPPFHASCKCELRRDITDSVIEDFVPTGRDSGNQLEMAMRADGRAADCEKCGKLALRLKDTPDVYNCRACKHSFRKKE